MTGKNPISKQFFSKDNVFISFQLTKMRSELAKSIRQAKAAKKIKQYSVDQNGRLTVLTEASSSWTEVPSLDKLNEIIR